MKGDIGAKSLTIYKNLLDGPNLSKTKPLLMDGCQVAFEDRPDHVPRIASVKASQIPPADSSFSIQKDFNSPRALYPPRHHNTANVLRSPCSARQSVFQVSHPVNKNPRVNVIWLAENASHFTIFPKNYWRKTNKTKITCEQWNTFKKNTESQCLEKIYILFITKVFTSWRQKSKKLQWMKILIPSPLLSFHLACLKGC